MVLSKYKNIYGRNVKKSKVQEKFDIRNNFEKTKYLGKRIGGAIWFHAAR
jgi:hypothetical protein